MSEEVSRRASNSQPPQLAVRAPTPNNDESVTETLIREMSELLAVSRPSRDVHQALEDMKNLLLRIVTSVLDVFPRTRGLEASILSCTNIHELNLMFQEVRERLQGSNMMGEDALTEGDAAMEDVLTVDKTASKIVVFEIPSLNNYCKIVVFKGPRLNDLQWFAHSKIRTLGDNSADSPALPLKSSFETVILPAELLNMATNRTEDIASFYKFSASHIEYYDKPAEMPFLRPATIFSLRHKRVNTTVDNVRKLFGDSVGAAVPAQLDLYLFKYGDKKVFWAVELRRVFVIVKGFGMVWRPWVGPEQGFSELAIAKDMNTALKLASERNAEGSTAGRFGVAKQVSTGPVFGVQASFRF